MPRFIRRPGQTWQRATRRVVKDIKRQMRRALGPFARSRLTETVEILNAPTTPAPTDDGVAHYLRTSGRFAQFFPRSVRQRQRLEREARLRRERIDRTRAAARGFVDRRRIQRAQRIQRRRVGRAVLRGNALRGLADVVSGRRREFTYTRSRAYNPTQFALDLLRETPASARLVIRVETEGPPVMDERLVTMVPSVEVTEYTLNEDFRRRVLDMLTDTFFETANGEGSDTEFVGNLFRLLRIVVRRVEGGRTLRSGAAKTTASGAFFPYLLVKHAAFAPLERYGLYRTVDASNYTDNCLVRALEHGGASEEVLTGLRCACRNRSIPARCLRQLCDTHRIRIRLQKRTGSKRDGKAVIYGPRGDDIPQFELGLVAGHYFINEASGFTGYAIKNFRAVRRLRNFQHIAKARSRGGYKRNPGRVVSSFKLVSLLVENKDDCLRPIPYCRELYESQFYDKGVTMTCLRYSKDQVKEVEPPKGRKESQKTQMSWFLDFEASTDGSRHRAFYCSLRAAEDGTNHRFYGWECATLMLDFLKANHGDAQHTLIAHNMSYDIRHIVSHVKMTTYLVNGSAFVKASGGYKGMALRFKCSYRIIVSPLSRFGKMFPDIGQEKEVCPYGLFTQACIEQRWVPVASALDDLEAGDHAQFLANIDRWGIRGGDNFDLVEYSARYCDIDTAVLRQGWDTFRGWILEHLEIDIDEVLTVPSLAMRYLTENGCFDGCYKLSGVPRHFIQRCVVGGKTMTRHNRKFAVDDPDRPIADFDGVSLYPSAMRRLTDEVGGFLMGRPKVIPSHRRNLAWLSQQDGYFVECVVESVGRDRALPLLSYIDDHGIRRWSNQKMVDKTIHIDKTSLEDAMKFQDARFRIVRGYYFDEGRNPKIGEVIQRVFDQRLAFKKQGNPVQAVFKLIMNAGYGGTCIRPSETKTRIVSTKERDNQFQLNYNHIKTSTQVSENQHYLELVAPIDDHFNLVHTGVEILSMSKRIMNEVMCTAEDAGRKVFITDTDSLHIHEDELDGLAADFKARYGRDLVGKQLGQFHTDFDLDGCHSVIAKRAIFLGKKCYLDHLTGIDKKTGDTREGWHIRMKGVPNASIWHAAKRDFGGDIWSLYSHLLSGQPVEFDLLCGGKKCSFESGKDMTVRSRTAFTRRVRFP